MPDYEKLAEGSWDAIPEQKTLPNGTYKLGCRGASHRDAEGDKKETVLFTYAVKEALDDVDTDALAALGDGYDIGVNKVWVRFFIEDPSDWNNVRKHLIKHGVDTAGRSIADTLKAAKGAQVFAYLKSRTYKNAAGEDVTENVAGNFSPAA